MELTISQHPTRMKTKYLEFTVLGIAIIVTATYVVMYFTNAPTGTLDTMRYFMVGSIALYVAYVFLTQQKDKDTQATLSEQIEILEAEVETRNHTIADQKQDIDRLKGELGNVQKKLDDTEKKFEQATKDWKKEKAELEAKIEKV